MQDLVIIQRKDLREELRAELTQALDKKFESFLSRLSSQTALSPADELLSRKDAAKYLGVSVTTLWQWTNDGVVIGHRISARIRYKKSELEQALNKIKTKA